MLKFIALAFFKLNGWRIEGHMPPEINQCVLVAAPHTSNYDLLYAMATFYQLKIPARYLIKKECAHFFLLKRMFKNSGALGVNRSKSNTMVDTLAELFNKSNDDLFLMVAPEGTRKLNQKWKTGFYYTALKAKVPIVLSSLDYKKKVAAIGPIIIPPGCFKTDMQIAKDYYKNITPKFPAKFGLDIYDLEESTCTG